MLSKDLDERKLVFPCWAEPKYDGVRVLAKVNKKEQTVKFFFRSGKEVLTLDHLIEPCLDIDAEQDEFTLDGEVTNEEGFMKCVGDIRRKSKQAPHLRYELFDMFFEDDDRDYLTRKKDLKEATKTSELYTLNYVKCDNLQEVMELKKVWEQKNKNIEGVIIKKNTSYQHKRTWDWMKIKDELSVDFPVVDAYEGKGKYDGMLGGFIVENPKTNVRISVGGGYSDEERYSFWNDLSSHIGKTAEIKYQYMTPKGSLRHPVFKGFRIDK
jgi:ATP-dependent DNA ligase